MGKSPWRDPFCIHILYVDYQGRVVFINRIYTATIAIALLDPPLNRSAPRALKTRNRSEESANSIIYANNGINSPRAKVSGGW